jgi:hypothetical protein
MTGSVEPPFPFSDLALARRLERCEARANAQFVEARARLFPDSGAEWIDVAGAYAMFDGPASPCTQTFGLGMFEAVTAAHMDRLEAFFTERGAPVFHEVCPLADSALSLLNERGYQPMEFTSVMFRPLGSRAGLTGPSSERIEARLARDDELDQWAELAARGWGASAELGDFMKAVGRISAAMPCGHPFIAYLDGQAIATAALNLCDGVAQLAGASTIPERRGRGAQLALLDARLRYAAQHGCDLVTMGAQPGSGSQRNAERHGFRIAYTRIKWRLHH